MERLAFQRDRVPARRSDDRALQRIVVAHVVILVVGVVLAGLAPRTAIRTTSGAGPRALEDGARPQPGRRF